MKRTYKITGYAFNSNPDGTLKGKFRAKILLELDGGQADADVIKAVDGTEETITGTLVAHIASQASRETDFTLTADNIDYSFKWKRFNKIKCGD